MKIRSGKWLWKISLFLALAVLCLVSIVALYVAYLKRPDSAAQKSTDDARQLLRQQGFKTDLAEFDFSTSPELRAREAILKNTVSNRFSGSFPEHPNLLPPIGNNSAVVVWKLDSLKRESRSSYDDNEQLSWNEFREAINQNQSLYDPACLAILSGPIRFNLDASRGSDILLPHLAIMKNLAQTFGDRTLLALHDGNQSATWTNLLAATRLITAYEPEPVEIAHLVRFACARLAYNTVWQTLQTNGWSDQQLARLQAEWEATDYFTNLPDTMAFKRASSAAACQQDRQPSFLDGMTVNEFVKESFHHPQYIVPAITSYMTRLKNARHGGYEDEKNALLFYRDRELELRHAITLPTWATMRPLPGVTNHAIFQSQHYSRMHAMLNLREIQQRGSGFLGRAAEAEVGRRIIVTAIALERYHAKYGAYPKTLIELAPAFLKIVPVDFMDGQPLHYHLTDDGHFLLYSVGLDCVDNDGKMRRSWRDDGFDRPPRPNTPEAEFDLVWPRPNSDASWQEEQQLQAKATKTKAKVKELRQKQYLKDISDREWQRSLARQSRVDKILAADWSAVDSEPTFDGHSVEEYAGNFNGRGTNELSLDVMLKPHQVITGQEPEDITFQFPIRYDAVTNNNMLRLMIDADPEDNVKLDSGGQAYDVCRATNGDTLIVWHAIYEPIGPHAVQSYFVLDKPHGEILYMWGRPVAFTNSNLCQFSFDCANYDADQGAIFHARLPEKNGTFSIECVTTNGERLKTLTGSTTSGEFKVIWNLMADDGHRLTGETFNSVVTVSLPDSGRTQTLRGP